MVTVPGHIKYLIANPEVWKSFRGAHGVPAAPPSVDGCGMKNVEMKYGEFLGDIFALESYGFALFGSTFVFVSDRRRDPST